MIKISEDKSLVTVLLGDWIPFRTLKLEVVLEIDRNELATSLLWSQMMSARKPKGVKLGKGLTLRIREKDLEQGSVEAPVQG